MREFDIDIHPRNQILVNLCSTDGYTCGELVLQQAFQSEVVMSIGAPGIGKSSFLAQAEDELHLRGFPTERVVYDDELALYEKETGSHEEGHELNHRFLRRVVDAVKRMRLRRGKVLIDNCGVGATDHKDRCVTAADIIALGKLPLESPPQVTTIALVGCPKVQEQNLFRRLDIMRTPPENVLNLLEREHNIVIEGIPQGISARELGWRIQSATHRMARPEHGVRIRAEQRYHDLDILRREGVKPSYGVYVPDIVPSEYKFAIQLEARGFERRRETLNLDHTNWITAINPPLQEPKTWYASSFLPQNNEPVFV